MILSHQPNIRMATPFGSVSYTHLDVYKRQAIDTEENNRRVSPHFMLASQHGATAAGTYAASRIKCRDYVERDATTGETYADWRMPTQAEIYLIDVLQNIQKCEVKGILEGHSYWSSNASSVTAFMDPRVGESVKSVSYTHLPYFPLASAAPISLPSPDPRDASNSDT